MPTLGPVHLPRPIVMTRVVGVLLALALLVFAGQASYSSSSPDVHVVASGDTLWGIALDNHVTVDQLAATNGLNPNAILPIGIQLTIPSSDSSATPLSSSVNSSSATSTSASTSNDFCATNVAPSGSISLPAVLSDSASRLALRPLFVEWADQYGVSPALVEAIAWQESGWQEDVVSSASAVGVGQLLPSTSTFVSQTLLGTNLDINSASDNIQMEARYLAYLQQHEGTTCGTIAGYYEGLQNMETYGVLPESEPYVTSVEALIPSFTP